MHLRLCKGGEELPHFFHNKVPKKLQRDASMPLQGGGRASPFFLQFGVKKVVVWCIYTFARRGKSFPLILQSRAKKVAMWCIYAFTKRRKSFQLFFAIWRKKKVAVWCIYAFAKRRKSFPIFFAIIFKKSCSVMQLHFGKVRGCLSSLLCNYLKKVAAWCGGESHRRK